VSSVEREIFILDKDTCRPRSKIRLGDARDLIIKKDTHLDDIIYACFND